MKPYLLTIGLLMLHALLLGQNRYDIVIDEIMADPAPPNGLPNNEWIELKNTSSLPVNLQDWRLADATGQSGPMPNFILQPDSFVIVCSGNALAAMSVFGTAISITSFPSLDNDGDQLFLKTANGMIMHAVSYSLAWYQNDIKKEGGWTLEMIDTHSPCGGMNNWKASQSTTGGTPGKKSSVDGINNDITGPQLKQAYTIGDNTIILVFDEPLDSVKGSSFSNYSIDGGIAIVDAITLSPLFDRVQLKTNISLTENTVYTITANQVTDCKGNLIGTNTKTRTGLPADPGAGEWIINEILFNPRSGAYDYVEFYNNSSRIFNAAKLFIATRNSSGGVGSAKVLSVAPFYVFPGDHIVATEDADNLALNYLVKHPTNVLAVSSMPSFPDDAGTVVALNSQGEVVDEVAYKDDWHFKLIATAEAVSLERIDPGRTSQDASNWHSAGSTAGYGTPTYKNSQYKQRPGVIATIEVLPKVFSPDNDGFDDVGTIQYKIAEPGYVANITIFDAAGNPVKHLVRNDLLAISGYWNWDGLDDKDRKLPVGTYIIFTEMFNPQGKKARFKNVIVLARKLN